MFVDTKANLAYVIGVALGDGNLSRPNGRVTRLRVTCDAQYPEVALEITKALTLLFPQNKVSLVAGPKQTYFNISVHSTKLDKIIPWKIGLGSKFVQNANVPGWIRENNCYTKACLRGLIQTDGSIYLDRGYKMVNFTNNTLALAESVKNMMKQIGFLPRMYEVGQKSGNQKYTVRLSKNVDRFIEEVSLRKA